MDEVIVAEALLLLLGGGGGGDGDEALWWRGSCVLSGIRASGIPIRPGALDQNKDWEFVCVFRRRRSDMGERGEGQDVVEGAVESVCRKTSYHLTIASEGLTGARLFFTWQPS